VMTRRNFWAALVGIGVVARPSPEPKAIEGDIHISFTLDGRFEPEQWLDWLYKNNAGIRSAIAESVLKMRPQGPPL
jgi:hypothetical protein